MDIAKAFEILSQGKIISSNSSNSKYTELSNMLLTDSFIDELRKILDLIGYEFIFENGYYYISKKGSLNSTEQKKFIQKNKELIVAVSFLRQLYPRCDKGSVISFLNTAQEYMNIKEEDSSIKDKLAYFSFINNKEDEKGMLELFFKFLETNNILERQSIDNSDKYKILNSILYYISIVESLEKGYSDD